MELLAWEVRWPNAMTWEVHSFSPPWLQFWCYKYYYFYHSAICTDSRVAKGIVSMSSADAHGQPLAAWESWNVRLWAADWTADSDCDSESEPCSCNTQYSLPQSDPPGPHITTSSVPVPVPVQQCPAQGLPVSMSLTQAVSGLMVASQYLEVAGQLWCSSGCVGLGSLWASNWTQSQAQVLTLKLGTQ